MKFAEQLNNWKNTEPAIIAAEKALRDYIGTKVRFEVSELRKSANNNKNGLGVRLFEYSSFMEEVISQIFVKYGMTVEKNYFISLVVESLNNNKDIYITAFREAPDAYLIWTSTKSEKCQSIIDESIKLWLENIVLKDFEKKFKEFFSKNLNNSITFRQNYSCSSITPFIIHLSGQFSKTIKIEKPLDSLLKTTGLKYTISMPERTFTLKI